MKSETLSSALRTLQIPGIDWMGLREVHETTSYRAMRDGKPQNNHRGLSHGVMIEVLVDGQFGYAATSRTDVESLHACAIQARDQAKKAAAHALFRFTTAQRPKVNSQYISPAAQNPNDFSAQQINDILARICAGLKIAPKIVRTTAMFNVLDIQTHFVSTNGSDAFQELKIISHGFEATAQDGNIVQRRTDGGGRGRTFQGGWELFETPDLWDRVRRTADQALELVVAPQCPDVTTDLVLTPDQMMLQIHESIGHPLELDRILGDERNYAGWSFVKLQDFGRLKYGSDLMNVSFDPSEPHELASYGFDDTGVTAQREFLIEKGVLKRGLGGMESQIRSGVAGVSNMRASSWNRAPIDRMANINLEPGATSYAELLASVEDGILMESNRSWSIDDFRNKFQFGCEYARRIRNGKVGEVLRNPNYRGVTVPFWQSLKSIGDAGTRAVFGTPNCGKGEPNQVIRVGHASPVCVFSGVQVFGGAA